MKKLALVGILSLVCSVDVNAAEDYFVTGRDITKYKENIQFLECIYSNANNCDENKSIEQTRKDVEKIKDGYSAGLNASKKKALDEKAKILLKKISVKEAKNFLENYKTLTYVEQLELFLDSAILKTVMTTKSAGAIEAEARGEKFEGPQTSTQVYKKTKQQALASFKSFEAEKKIAHRPDYYPTNRSPEVSDLGETYTLNADSTQVTCKMNKEISLKNVGEYNDSISKTVLVRDGKNNIRVAGLENTVKTVQKEVNPEDNIINANLNSFDILDTKQDMVYSNQYAEQEEIARKERLKKNSILVLEMVVNTAERLMQDALESEDKELQKEKIDEALKTIKGGAKYYSMVSSYKDEKSKEVASRYLGLRSRMQRAGL